jgi:glycosyltransferase involved in cell wall biosynthesis
VPWSANERKGSILSRKLKMMNENETIAVLIPCFNEEKTVGKVITDFRMAIPSAKIYVFDNNSSDRTAQMAGEYGAIVFREKKKGKGHVVQSIFQKIDADYYVMVDGDDTYPAEFAKNLLEMVVNDQSDMAVGNRLLVYGTKAFRPFHVTGNSLVRRLVNRLFGVSLMDIMSGFRVMSREVVHGITIQSKGFEVETEITLQCLTNGFVIGEIDIPYRERPQGSFSKLRTFRDGYLVLKAILIIFRDYKPLWFFGSLAAFFFLIGIASGSVVVTEFIETHYITHVPLAIFAVGCVLSGIVMSGIGLILDSIKNRFNEIYSFIRRRTFK